MNLITCEQCDCPDLYVLYLSFSTVSPKMHLKSSVLSRLITIKLSLLWEIFIIRIVTVSVVGPRRGMLALS